MQPLRIGVLGSGSGSNFQALLDAIASGSLPAEIVLVMSDVPEARILERAHFAGIPSSVIDCGGHTKKFPLASQQSVADAMMAAGAELICLAGFMRLIKTPLLHAFPKRIINIHPSILPAFPGLEAWKQALDAGVTETGCTVHYVDAGMDTGPIIQQVKVPVYTNDTYASLHARIQEQEHVIYPSAILKIIPTLTR
ncbi:MAG: phosphoribosylglycinamide formyltransferase [Verrucomicrobia bacterium]|jgi:phosphoribosylglycinamide formyltransferase-1|nr:MAG: phosphoribosylglycinamide formyltransferase [Verrucomicrobiota bacterium]